MILMSARLNLLSALEAAGKIRPGEISFEELLRGCLHSSKDPYTVLGI
jgi:hypothetical protein